jgi:hypothetical protein
MNSSNNKYNESIHILPIHIINQVRGANSITNSNSSSFGPSWVNASFNGNKSYNYNGGACDGNDVSNIFSSGDASYRNAYS